MYRLSQKQVYQVTQSIIDSGVSYAPLLDELTDHICEEVEELMLNGYSFSEALSQAISQYKQGQLANVNRDMFEQISYRTMIKSYLKLGIRSLAKHRLTSSINLVGLTLGISVFLLIGSYVYHESSFDKFHASADKIYRVTTEQTREDGSIRRSAFSGAPWGPELLAGIPGATDMTRLMKYRLPVSVRSEQGDKHFYEKDLIWADNSFFSVFSYELLEGDPVGPLNAPNQAVLTESAAQRYFGSADPVGKYIIYENDVVLHVTGVVADFPANSYIQADIIGSFATLGTGFWFNIIDNWNVLYYYTYLQFDHHIQPAQTEDKIKSILSNYINPKIDIRLQPITQIHTSGNLENELSPNTSSSALTISILVGLTILFLSVINYINLSNARALKRVKEVGVVKVMGSTKSLVFVQFMVESFVLSLASFLVSLLLVVLLFPGLKYFLGMSLIVPPNYLVVIVGIVIILFVTVCAGGYTALKMADVSIASALRGKSYHSPRGFTLRKALITFQFMSGLGLVGAMLIISDQVNYFISADTGYSKENIIEIPLYIEDTQKLETFKNELQGLAAIGYVALSSHRMSGDQLYRSRYSTTRSDSVVMGRLHIDYDFINTFEIDLVAGRSFSKDFTSDTSAFIINKSAAVELGFHHPSDALGNKLYYLAQNQNGNYIKSGPIVGVVKDFNFKSLHDNIGAMVMDIQPPRNHFLNIKLEELHDPTSAVKQVEDKWNELFPNEPFNYFFVDDRYLGQYRSETQLQKIVFAFSVIAILISILGLFGLTYFDTAIRSKEISLRKVMGASTFNILRIFLKDYFVLIIIGFVIITPIITWLMDRWLNNFAYHVQVTSWSILIPILLMGTVVILTTSFTIVKAANSNPIESLNHE